MIQSKRILFCLRYGIGDVVMEMPALRGLRLAQPGDEIHLLGALPALELFEGDRDFQSLICIHDFGFEHWGDLGDERKREDFRLWLLQQNYHTILDPFHAVYGIQEILTGSGIPWHNSDPKPPLPQCLHGGLGVATIWRNSVEIWGLDNLRHQPPPAPQPHLPAAAWQSAADFLNGWLEHPDKMPVGIAPIASSPLKRWPLERVLELVGWLTREARRQVLIFGVGEQESRLFRDAAPEDHLKIVVPTHLQVTAALAGHCAAFVSNDTGLMHLAAAMDTPTLGIFGPTAAHIYLPPNSLAVRSKRPCDYRLLEHFGPPQCVHAARCLVAEESCIATIDTEAVREKLEELMRMEREPREAPSPLLSNG